MPRYFFDIHDGGPAYDDTGTEFATLDDVRAEARRTLPDIAREDIPKGDDKRTFTCLVTEEGGKPVYAATITYAELWLQRDRRTTE